MQGGGDEEWEGLESLSQSPWSFMQDEQDLQVQCLFLIYTENYWEEKSLQDHWVPGCILCQAILGFCTAVLTSCCSGLSSDKAANEGDGCRGLELADGRGWKSAGDREDMAGK